MDIINRIELLNHEVRAKLPLIEAIMRDNLSIHRFHPSSVKKHALVIPFIQKILGCDITDPSECLLDLEYEDDHCIYNVDYSIMLGDRPCILIFFTDYFDWPIQTDDDWTNRALKNAGRASVSLSSAKYSIITDGIKYRIFKNIKTANGFDLSSLGLLDISDIKEAPLSHLVDMLKYYNTRKHQKNSLLIEMLGNLLSNHKNDADLTNQIMRTLSRKLGEFNFIPSDKLGECQRKLVIFGMPPFYNEQNRDSFCLREMCAHLERCPITDDIYIFTDEWHDWIPIEFKRCIEKAISSGKSINYYYWDGKRFIDKSLIIQG